MIGEKLENKKAVSLKQDHDLLIVKINELNAKSYEIRNSNTDGSRQLANDALRLSDEINYAKGKAFAINNIGFSNIVTSGYEEALNNLNDSFQIFQRENDEEGLAAVSYNFGVIFIRLGDFEKSIDFQNKSLSIREKLNDKMGIANSLFQIAFIHHQFKEYDEAIKFVTRSLEIYRKLKDNIGIAAQLMVMGMCYSDKGENEKALEYLNESIELRKHISDQRGYGSVLYVTGNHHLKNGDHKKAMEYLKKGLEVSINERDKVAQVRLYHSIGKLHSTVEEYGRSRENLSAGIALANENKINSLLPDLYETLAHVAEKEKKFEEAFLNYKKHTQYKASVFNSETSTKMKHASILKKMEAASMEAEIHRLKNVELKNAHDEIEQKNKDITDSINYAKRIQYTLLAHDELLKNNLPEYFVLFKPKDIVSGDFYWATKKGKSFYLAACDSTGHGVPGAFMSLLNISFLNEAISEKLIGEPNKVLDHVRRRLVENISRDGQQDGMDGILVCLEESKITYAAAYNSPVLISDGKLSELYADKMPVGKSERTENFKLQTLNLKKGDCLYLFTDGFADQFGGPNGKKFLSKRLNELLLSIGHFSIGEQKNKLEEAFINWKGNLEQVDDVCVIGIKV